MAKDIPTRQGRVNVARPVEGRKAQGDGLRMLPADDVPPKEVPSYLLQRVPKSHADESKGDGWAVGGKRDEFTQNDSTIFLKGLTSGLNSAGGAIFCLVGTVAAFVYFGPIGAIIFLLFEIAMTLASINKKK